jgi:hypothetical protein
VLGTAAPLGTAATTLLVGQNLALVFQPLPEQVLTDERVHAKPKTRLLSATVSRKKVILGLRWSMDNGPPTSNCRSTRDAHTLPQGPTCSRGKGGQCEDHIPKVGVLVKLTTSRSGHMAEECHGEEFTRVQVVHCPEIPLGDARQLKPNSPKCTIHPGSTAIVGAQQRWPSSGFLSLLPPNRSWWCTAFAESLRTKEGAASLLI